MLASFASRSPLIVSRLSLNHLVAGVILRRAAKAKISACRFASSGTTGIVIEEEVSHEGGWRSGGGSKGEVERGEIGIRV